LSHQCHMPCDFICHTYFIVTLLSHKEKTLPRLNLGSVDFTGAPGRTRTTDQRFRKPLLYPPELQTHILLYSNYYSKSSEPCQKDRRFMLMASLLQIVPRYNFIHAVCLTTFTTFIYTIRNFQNATLPVTLRTFQKQESIW
jgi:hypothetical protein